MTKKKTYKLRRGKRSALARVVGTCFAAVVLWPLTKLLALFGLWPGVMARALNGMQVDFDDYVPDEQDVFICSYFKSGTNWTMQIALQITYRGEAQFEHIHDLVPWPEMPPRTAYAVPLEERERWRVSPTGLGIIKTHYPLFRIPFNDAAKYIYVVRDPKDVFVSSYHFVKSVGAGFLMPPVDKWLDTYLSEDTPLGSWAQHLHEGWEQRHRNNVLFLTFEEMKADLRGAVIRISQFMGVDLTESEIDRVVEQSTYEFMKSIGHKFDVPHGGSPWASGSGAMVRRGQRGVSDEMLSIEGQRRIDDHWRAELRRLGSDFAYDAVYAVKD